MRDAEVDEHAAVALLILRFVLGIFLVQSGIEKVILPGSAVRIANLMAFYGVSLPPAASYAAGTACAGAREISRTQRVTLARLVSNLECVCTSEPPAGSCSGGSRVHRRSAGHYHPLQKVAAGWNETR